MFNLKFNKQKVLLIGLIFLGIFLWLDKRQYDQCKSLLSEKRSFYGVIPDQDKLRDRIMHCVKRVYGVDLTANKPTSTPAPLKPNKEVYTIGEKITYGYLILQVKEIKKVGLDLTALDVYVYNSKDNPRDIYITGGQFSLETPDKIRIPPVQTTFEGGHLKPDEGDNGTIYFNNYSIQQADLLKMTPFEGSPSLVIDLKL